MTFGSLAELPGTAELSLPISATRALVGRGTILSLRDGGGTRWSIPIGTGRAVAGALLFDGRAAAVHVAGGRGRDLILVLALRDGAIERRVIVDNARVQFAARAGLAVAHVERERVVVIDLRLGRVIANHAIDRAVASVRVEPTGTIELVAADGTATLLDARSSRVASGTQPPPIAEAIEPAIEPAATAIEPATEPAAAAPELEARVDQVAVADDPAGSTDHEADPPDEPRPLAVPHLRALPTCDPRARITAAEQATLLHALRERARCVAALAIARRWDTGRLAFDQGHLPHRAEVAGLLGMTAGLATDEIHAATDRLAAAITRQAELACATVSRWTPAALLACELALSPLAIELVIAIAAPQLWRDVGRLYELLEDRVDSHLLATLLGDLADPTAIARELQPDAPLLRLGVVRADGGRLTVDRVVLRLLCGDAPLGELAPIVRPRPADRRLSELDLRDGVIRSALAELETAPAPLRLVVRGREGSGGRSLVATIVEATGRLLCTIDGAALLREPKTCARELEVALQRAYLAGVVPCVTGLDRIPADQHRLRDELEQVIDGHPGPLAIRGAREARPPIGGAHVAIDLPVPTPSERRAAWAAGLARAGLTGADADLLADRYAIGPAVIARVVASVEPGFDTTTRLDRAVRRHLETQLGAVATRIDRLAEMSQVILPPDIEDSVTELIARVRHRATVFDAWGFDRVMSTSRGTTALFQGVPGTGKTMVAGAIARALGLELYRVDISKIMSKWIGETEQNLARLFDAAEDSQAMLLFDEADSLFAKRTEVKSSTDRYANAEVNYLLQRLDSFEGIAVLCTNFGSSIDSAFKRRMSFRLTFPFPDEEQRERLWKAHVPAGAPIADIDFAAFARRFQLSGGYIRNCMLRTAFLAAEHGGSLTAALLERAIKAEFREIGKLAQTGALE